MTAAPVKRQICMTCMRPQSACICRWITPVAPATQMVEVLILQHPLELGNAKGSARLLHLSLPRSRMLTGEVFTAQDLPASPFEPDAVENSPKYNILLYPPAPNGPQDQGLGLLAPSTLRPELLHDPSQLRLIVLDGTWRKSRKMLYLNPLLQQLPRLSLQGLPASKYLIRKAHQPDQLSTLEATCAALIQLERSVQKYQPLLAAFDGFVAQQLGYREGGRQE